MVLNINKKIALDDAVDIICPTAGLEEFQTTTETKKAIDDLVLAAEVRSAVIDLNHGKKISARDGIVFIRSEATLVQQSPLIHDIEKIVKEIPGVKDMRIDVEPIFPLANSRNEIWNAHGIKNLAISTGSGYGIS